jgi:hypothetical protein
MEEVTWDDQKVTSFDWASYRAFRPFFIARHWHSVPRLVFAQQRAAFLPWPLGWANCSL